MTNQIEIIQKQVKVDNKEISSLFFENTIRAEMVINFAIQCVGDSFSSDVSESINDDWELIWEQVGCSEPEYRDDESIAWHLFNNNKFGFLIKFATPVPRNFKENGFEFSWGYYATKWIYAETWDKASQLAVEWAEEYISNKKSESRDVLHG